jgi:hypothetical protein
MAQRREKDLKSEISNLGNNLFGSPADQVILIWAVEPSV